MPSQSVEEAPSLFHQFSGPLWHYYGLSLQQCFPMRSVVGIGTTGGSRYIWKPIRSDPIATSLPTVAAVTRRLQRLGVGAAHPITTRFGGYLSTVNVDLSQSASEQTDRRVGSFLRNNEGYIGYLQPWLEGRHVRLHDRQERLFAIAGVALLHRCTAEPPRWHWRERTLLEMKFELKRAFLLKSWANLRYAFPQLQRIENDLMKNIYQVSRVFLHDGQHSREAPLCYCHRDLAAHNILWQNEGIAFIDFDLAAMDDRVGDVVQLANHVLQQENLTSSAWDEMFEVYATLVNLPEADHARLLQMTAFPDVLARACAEWMKNPTPTNETRVYQAIANEETRLELLATTI